ncbi:MAG: T9SS type A sorting domain-containing protein [Bacteroidota bacterium]
MKSYLLTIISLFFTYFLHANAGFFDSFAILNVNGGGNTFFDLGATTGNTDFQGANIGSFDPGAQSLILGGQSKTFKNNGTDVFGVSIFYRIYPAGAPSGAFVEIPYSFQTNIGVGGDQQWGTDVNGANTTDGGVEILTGTNLVAGNYNLEVFVKVTTNGVNAPMEIFDSNGGANYVANFTVTTTLPVELLDFNAKSTGKKIVLDWRTAAEFNNSHFEIERSTNAKTWKIIGKVQGQGTKLEQQNYQFSDIEPLKGKNYYRLKQIDFDGQFEYSSSIVARFDILAQLGFDLSPNPTNGSISYSTFEDDAIQSISIYDTNGKLIETVRNINGFLSIDHLDKGMYILIARGINSRYRQTVIKQ